MEKNTKIRSNIQGFSRRKRGNTIKFAPNTGREIQIEKEYQLLFFGSVRKLQCSKSALTKIQDFKKIKKQEILEVLGKKYRRFFPLKSIKNLKSWHQLGTGNWLPEKVLTPKTGYLKKYGHQKLATRKRDYRQQISFPGSQFWMPILFRVANFGCQYLSFNPNIGDLGLKWPPIQDYRSFCVLYRKKQEYRRTWRAVDG